MAFLVLLTGITLTAFSLSEITTREAPEAAIVKSISYGRSHYYIKSYSKCVGEITTTLEKPKGYALTFDGNIKAKYQSASTLATLTASASFNTLGQLNSFDLNIDAKQVKLNFNGRGVNPIKIRIDSAYADSAVSKQLLLPGPIQLLPEQITAKSYFISYPRLQITKLLSRISLSPEASNNIPLRVERDQDQSNCSQTENFEIESLLSSYQYFLAMANQIPNQLFGGSLDQH